MEETTISITDFTQRFIPSLIDDYLLEFCKQYADKLERKDLQLSASPAPKGNGKEKKVKIKTPTFIVMLEVAETLNKEDEFLPKNFINRTDKFAKYKKAIFDKFGFVYSESTINNNIDKHLTARQRLEVIKMLNEYGRRDLAEQYRIHYKSIR